MADLILVHLTLNDEEYLINRDLLVYARRSPSRTGSLIRMAGDESFGVKEDLESLMQH